MTADCNNCWQGHAYASTHALQCDCPCHQRPESECNIDPLYIGVCNRGIKCCTEYHQRPESWREEFDYRFKHTDKNEIGYVPVFRTEDIKSFIARTIAAERRAARREAYAEVLKLTEENTHAEWPEEKEAFINKLIALYYKYWPEKIQPCPDCGGMSLHLCEFAFRKQNAAFFDKIYQHGLDMLRDRLQSLLASQQEPTSE